MKVALLRGINVGGKKKILMKDLSKLFHDLGLSDVKTYIQSGNIIFNDTGNKTEIELEKIIEAGIKDRFSFEVPTIIIGQKDFLEAISNNPFQGEDLEKLLITFLNDLPKSDKIAELSKGDYTPDLFEIKEKFVYLNCINKYHKTKLSNNLFEKKLGLKASTRNWKTISAISKLLLEYS